jgi:hypothetical protein
MIRCVFPQAEMRATAMVVAEVRGQHAAQVHGIQNDEVIEALATDGPDQPLDEWVLPGTRGTGDDLGDRHAGHTSPEIVVVNAVSVAQQPAWCGVVGKRIDDLLRRPLGRGCSVTLKCTTRRRSCESTSSTNKTRPVTDGTVKKSIEAAAATWFVRKVRHDCDGGRRRRVNRRETVRSEMSIPRVQSSPWMRGAPHNGFAAAISRTRACVFASILGGRPTRPCRERRIQRQRNHSRCHRTTVSGWTNIRAERHRVQMTERAIQNSRSRWLRHGRTTERLRAVSCCRSAIFSRTSS